MSVSARPVRPRRSRPTQLAAGLAMTALVLTAGACSADDTGPAPESAASTSSSTETSAVTTGSEAGSATTGAETPTTTATSRTAASPSRGSDAGAASTMTCAEFRELDDAERSAVLTELDVTANAEQVATVAATVCLSRPDDTIAAVIAELVPR